MGKPINRWDPSVVLNQILTIRFTSELQGARCWGESLREAEEAPS